MHFNKKENIKATDVFEPSEIDDDIMLESDIDMDLENEDHDTLLISEYDEMMNDGLESTELSQSEVEKVDDKLEKCESIIESYPDKWLTPEVSEENGGSKQDIVSSNDKGAREASKAEVIGLKERLRIINKANTDLIESIKNSLIKAAEIDNATSLEIKLDSAKVSFVTKQLEAENLNVIVKEQLLNTSKINVRWE